MSLVVKRFFITVLAGDTQKRIVFGCHPPKHWKKYLFNCSWQICEPSGNPYCEEFFHICHTLVENNLSPRGLLPYVWSAFPNLFIGSCTQDIFFFFSATCCLMPGETSPIIKLSPTNITLGRLANSMGIIFMNLLFTKILILPITANLGASSHFQLKVCCLDLLFRWFKFTLKPPYTVVHGNLLSAIWDTSHWTFFVKFGLKTA